MASLSRSFQAAVLVVVFCAPVQGQEWQKIADAIGTYAIPVEMAYRAYELHKDGATASTYWRRQACPALVAFGVSYGLKQIIDSPRPDGSDHMGAPSLHTAFAVSQVGRKLPITIAFAVGIGSSRRLADKHYWFQIAEGAGVGLLGQGVCAIGWSVQ